MESMLQLNKNEWEAFLEEFSELTKKFELLLSKLDLAEITIEGNRERFKQLTANSGEALKQIRTALERLCKETEDALNESK